MKAGPSEAPSPASTAADRKGQPSPAGGDFDAAKVARVAQAIRERRYVVDAGLIADKLIAHAGQLLGHRLG